MEETKKGVIIEFDFAVMDGAGILYDTTAKLFKEIGLEFNPRIEAQHLAGADYLGGIDEYFRLAKTKKTAAKAAKDISLCFVKNITSAFEQAVDDGFVAFATRLLEYGLRIVVTSRAENAVALKALSMFSLNPNFSIFEEVSQTYGSVKWDAWRRTAVLNQLRSSRTLAVAGSGFSAKAALLSGMGAVAVVNDHVAWQDYCGVDTTFKKLDVKAADKIAKIMKVQV